MLYVIQKFILEVCISTFHYNPKDAQFCYITICACFYFIGYCNVLTVTYKLSKVIVWKLFKISGL